MKMRYVTEQALWMSGGIKVVTSAYIKIKNMCLFTQVINK